MVQSPYKDQGLSSPQPQLPLAAHVPHALRGALYPGFNEVDFLSYTPSYTTAFTSVCFP